MKKILALVLALVLALGMVACGGGGENAGDDVSIAGTYDITVWVAADAVELTGKQIDAYNESNQDGVTINYTIEAVSEADAGTNMVTDVAAGGDLYCFAQDQFARLVSAGALSQLGKAAGETVAAANAAGVVAAATSGDTLYAYPLTADNGYFMYYDKSVIPEEDVDSLEKLIADCEAANKYFAMETESSAWYLASFFFATGCKSEWTTDDEGKFISVNDTFNSPDGLIAAKGIEKLVKSPMALSSSQAAEFASNAAVVVTGTWAYNDISAMLGDNLGVTDLPSFEVDGKEYHMGSFSGCKLLGVKPQTDAKKAAVLHKLAQYLTSEEAQLERFNTLAWGPANNNAAASEAVQANPGLAALLKQAPYSVPQGQIHGSWWDIAKVIATDVKAAADEAGLQAALDNYKNAIDSLFNMSADEANAWTVIGTVNGTNWDTDLEMEETADGVWTTKEAYELNAGDEFKVRQGKGWDNAFPAENFVVETAGTYHIQLTVESGEVALVD